MQSDCVGWWCNKVRQSAIEQARCRIDTASRTPACLMHANAGVRSSPPAYDVAAISIYVMGEYARAALNCFQRVEYFQFVNPIEVAGIACRQRISPFKAGGGDEGITERKFALLA